jgi:DNA-binding IclR family transcriptional regulator
VGLGGALARLHADTALDAVVRDLLTLVRHRPGERMTVDEIASRTGRPPDTLRPILTTMAECFVLDFDSGDRTYRYVPDAVLELAIERYLHRVDVVSDLRQNNIARFRQRHDHQ